MIVSALAVVEVHETHRIHVGQKEIARRPCRGRKTGWHRYQRIGTECPGAEAALHGHDGNIVICAIQAPSDGPDGEIARGYDTVLEHKIRHLLPRAVADIEQRMRSERCHMRDMQIVDQRPSGSRGDLRHLGVEPMADRQLPFLRERGEVPLDERGEAFFGVEDSLLLAHDSRKLPKLQPANRDFVRRQPRCVLPSLFDGAFR